MYTYIYISRIVQEYLGGPHPGVGGWVGVSFKGFFNGFFVFLEYLYCSHSVHTVFITVHAKFYSSSKEGPSHTYHTYTLYNILDLLVHIHRVKG